MITIFDSNKRFVLIEKAPFLVMVSEQLQRVYRTDKFYMVRELNKFDFEMADNKNPNLNTKKDYYMIVDFGYKTSNAEIGYIGCIINKEEVLNMNSYNKV